ncbi:MAG: bifunctional hydroxymethylpyrimidine kinase/phosphomethylpyrimidine kinase [Alphaproteobacteria bacterium]|nr:bifunctional hydroxymethylpyrimidine kinase/phosphomethylpyrimidine kinase [Alphaproteobacteria bacterium]
MKGRVLIIAGSDPSGGAGAQADIKTVTALGGYAAAAITALTVQDTTGVKSVHPVTPAIIRDQIEAVLDDIGADAIKIGMIGEEGAAHEIARILRARSGIPVVLDPVLAATSGDALAGEGVAGVLLQELLPLAALVTPNADEAAALTGLIVKETRDLNRAGAALLEKGARAVLVKGGHLSGPDIVDYLMTPAGATPFVHPRIDTTATHGTGCTLASAVATGLAQDLSLEQAVSRAIEYVAAAIRTAPGLGRGAGPLNHAHQIKV